MRSFRHRRKLLFVKVAAVNQILAFASELERVKLGRTWPRMFRFRGQGAHDARAEERHDEPYRQRQNL